MKVVRIEADASYDGRYVRLIADVQPGEDLRIAYIKLVKRCRDLVRDKAAQAEAELLEQAESQIVNKRKIAGRRWDQVKTVTQRIAQLQGREWTEEWAEEMFLDHGVFIGQENKVVRFETKEQLLGRKNSRIALEGLRETAAALESASRLIERSDNI